MGTVQATPTDVICPCGCPLHYSDPELQARVQELVDAVGPTVLVSTADGSWCVPRHYIALHGIRTADLTELAARLGFERIR